MWLGIKLSAKLKFFCQYLTTQIQLPPRSQRHDNSLFPWVLRIESQSIWTQLKSPRRGIPLLSQFRPTFWRRPSSGTWKRAIWSWFRLWLWWWWAYIEIRNIPEFNVKTYLIRVLSDSFPDPQAKHGSNLISRKDSPTSSHSILFCHRQSVCVGIIRQDNVAILCFWKCHGQIQSTSFLKTKLVCEKEELFPGNERINKQKNSIWMPLTYLGIWEGDCNDS